MQRAPLRIAEEERDLVDREAPIAQVARRELAPDAVEDLVEGAAFLAQAALERALAHPDLLRDRALTRLTGTKRRGEELADALHETMTARSKSQRR